MINLEYVFPTPIWSKIVNIEIEDIKNYILEEKEKSSGRSLSNMGGWQSNDYDMQSLKNTPLKDFNLILLKTLHLCFDDYGSTLKPSIGNMWFNVNPPGAYNTTHIHTNAFLSGVFYIDCDENSGDIIFERNSAEQYVLGTQIPKSVSKLSSAHWKYEPVPKKLIIFPAWLPHYVMPNKSNNDRISISFNIVQVETRLL